MVTVQDVFAFLRGFAPTETKMEFDNVGLLAGTADKEVRKILLALDARDSVIEQAIRLSAVPLTFSMRTFCRKVG